ncbi:MAG: ATP-binding protein [Armatimonadetes bacterium]|nr:ATP-binding protein [Armatimonadota bacterium]
MVETDHQQIQVELPTQPEFVRLVRLIVAGIGNSMRFNVDELEDLKLAVGEACYQVLQSTSGERARLRIVARLKVDGLEIELFTTHESDDEEGLYAFPGLELTDRRLGLTLMKQIVDEISFTSNSRSTSLKIFKRRRAAASRTRSAAGATGASRARPSDPAPPGCG